MAVLRENVPRPGPILAFHLFVLAAMALVPPRGAAWERPASGESRFRRNVRGGLRFFRYSYPLLLVVFFFEEVQRTVNMILPSAPYWFESHLYAADRFLFGELPATLLNPHVGMVLNEIFHGFYFSYYFILIGGVVMAWLGDGSTGNPSPAFQTTLTSALFAFIFCFVWYPFLPARGPWENPALMATMTPFRGVLFTPIIEKLIEHGAVSGGCFPSSHVAGSWAVVFGLAGSSPRRALLIGGLALGLSFACVYTRYHHAIDVFAGLLAAIAGFLVARVLARRPFNGTTSPGRS